MPIGCVVLVAKRFVVLVDVVAISTGLKKFVIALCLVQLVVDLLDLRKSFFTFLFVFVVSGTNKGGLVRSSCGRGGEPARTKWSLRFLGLLKPQTSFFSYMKAVVWLFPKIGQLFLTILGIWLAYYYKLCFRHKGHTKYPLHPHLHNEGLLAYFQVYAPLHIVNYNALTVVRPL